MQVFCEGGVFQGIVGGLESGVGGGVEMVEERGELHAHFEWVGHDGGDVSGSGRCGPGFAVWEDCPRCLWMQVGV